MFSVLVDDASRRDELRDFLSQAGIETRPLFYPVHTMPMYSTPFQSHRVAEDLGWRGINLPSYPKLENSQIIFICKLISNFFEKH
jgi:perosamine synthetase